jgi:hypothetical protein
MASALHQRYPDFAASLGPTLGKVAAGPGAANKAGTGGRSWQLPFHQLEHAAVLDVQPTVCLAAQQMLMRLTVQASAVSSKQ